MLPYNDALSQIAAEVALEMYESDLSPLVNRIIEGRENLFSELQQINGLSPVFKRKLHDCEIQAGSQAGF